MRQKAKDGRSREMDIFSDYEKIDAMLDENICNSIERELAFNISNGPVSLEDSGAHFDLRENSFQENKIRNMDSRNVTPRPDRLLRFGRSTVQ